ncbi:Two-pore potassium channel 4 [Cardamine amara subsp. amara]|uniref:Two-pore potassium channel 4 n=1 Tax=Cardamine amara subsp. amara TaxID=228776 RepID=A0ABD1BU39_CARAN
MENEILLSENLLPPQERSPETPADAAVPKSKWTILVLTIIFLFVYLALGVFTYSFFRDQFSGTETHPLVDALYFSIVTFCTVGYGDIVPSTSTAKILTIVLVSIGVVFLDFLLNRVVSHVLSLQESAILDRIKTRNRAIRDQITENGRIRIKWKLCLAFCAVFLCVAIGALFLHFVERLDLWDSVYLSVISVTTVGYGDKAFKTVQGRGFAVFWLLLSTIAMASLFIYFAEMRIDPNTLIKLPISESEFILSKLKESGKIKEDDINGIVTEFENRENVPPSGS